jgi:hypothetical protein
MAPEAASPPAELEDDDLSQLPAIEDRQPSIPNLLLQRRSMQLHASYHTRGPRAFGPLIDGQQASLENTHDTTGTQQQQRHRTLQVRLDESLRVKNEEYIIVHIMFILVLKTLIDEFCRFSSTAGL